MSQSDRRAPFATKARALRSTNHTSAQPGMLSPRNCQLISALTGAGQYHTHRLESPKNIQHIVETGSAIRRDLVRGKILDIHMPCRNAPTYDIRGQGEHSVDSSADATGTVQTCHKKHQPTCNEGYALKYAQGAGL